MELSRKFSVHPQMIFSLITAQAGTLGKAVLENIMNSVDAQATKVTIDITRKGIVIRDDGHGFRSDTEIEECFEVFGFPHEAGSRIYGQFGIGRAQLWAFCSAIWRTNTFCMDVDIKNRGLDYRLLQGQPQVDGLLIEAKFYKPMSTEDIMAFKRELKELALFAQIPVILDGEQLNTDPAKLKWDFETADAWIKISDTSTLTVYNLGVLVRKYSSYQVGSGGLVVTKPGVKLALNMARNDILVSECKVWGRVKPFIQKKSDEKVKRKTTRLTEAELENRATRFFSGALAYTDIVDLKLITDITGRGHTLAALMRKLTSRGFKGIVTVAEEGSNLGEQAHNSKVAFVLHPSTLDRADVDTVTELARLLVAALDRDTTVPRWWGHTFKTQLRFEDDLQTAVPALKDGYALVAASELTKKEIGVLSALRRVESGIRGLVTHGEDPCHRLAERALFVGVSDTAHAWTDARTQIVFDRKVLREADKGVGGFVHLLSILAHEYLHDASSAGSHVHDETFYKRFHDVHNGVQLGQFAFEAYRAYVGYLLAVGVAPTRRLLEVITFEENLETREPRESANSKLRAMAA